MRIAISRTQTCVTTCRDSENRAASVVTELMLLLVSSCMREDYQLEFSDRCNICSGYFFISIGALAGSMSDVFIA